MREEEGSGYHAGQQAKQPEIRPVKRRAIYHPAAWPSLRLSLAPM
jgi:hypothetical protein